jgi:hypothetical protein
MGSVDDMQYEHAIRDYDSFSKGSIEIEPRFDANVCWERMIFHRSIR